jgi:hypothetical protein
MNGTDVISLQGLGSTAGTSDVQVGLFVPAGNGSYTLSTKENNGGIVTSNALVSGTYSVAANGRGTLTAGTATPVIYLVSQDKGFLVGTDTSVTTGSFEPQTGGPFGNTSASGTYAFGSISPVAVANADQSGVATFTTPNVTGAIDKNSSGTLSAGSAITSTYSIDSTGLGLLPAGCSITGGTCQDVFFIVSPSKAVLLETASGKKNPNLQVSDK